MSKEIPDNAQNDSVETKEVLLMKGERKAENSLQYQIVLATQLFLKNDSDRQFEDKNVRNRIMEEWSNGSKHKNGSFSKAYLGLITHSEFKSDPLNITLQEVELVSLRSSCRRVVDYYLEHQKPEPVF